MCLLTSCAIQQLQQRGTHRTEVIILVFEKQVMILSEQSYTDYMKIATLSTNKKNAEMLVRIGKKIPADVEPYFTSQGH